MLSIANTHSSSPSTLAPKQASVARNINATIVKTSQQALQADGVTPLAVVGETHLALSRADKRLTLDALVVEDLDVDILAGTPFMIANDVSVRPAKRQVVIQGSEVMLCSSEENVSSHAHAVRRTQSYVLRSSAATSVIFPGEYLEVDVPPDLGPDCSLAIEARTDAPSTRYAKASQLWPQPHITEAVGNKVRIVNNSNEPRTIRRHEHFCQARPTTALDPSPAPVVPNMSSPPKGSSPTPQ